MGFEPMKRCGSHSPGHDPHHIPALRSGSEGAIRIAGRAQVVGDAIKFIPSDGQPAIMLHNHDLEGVSALIAAGAAVSLAPRWGVLRFRLGSTLDAGGERWLGTRIVSVTSDELSSCRLTVTAGSDRTNQPRAAS